MASKLSRFLHLERSRGEKAPETEPVSLRDGGRFESVAERGPASGAVGVPEAHLERFKPAEPLALELEADPGRSFSRCIRCERENGRFNRVCGTCGADLSAPEQREADERRGRQRQEEEARALEEMRVLRTEAPAPLPVHAEQEPEVPSVFEPSLGVGLVRSLPHPVARGLSVVGAVALPWLLTRGGRGALWTLGMYLGVFVAASLVPSAFWMKQRRDE